MRAADLDIPAGFEHWAGDPAEDHIGPFFFRFTANGCETAFRPRPHNCNSGGNVHGGVLMSFIDYTLCIAAIGDSGEHCVTVSLNSEFVDGVPPGALVLGEGEVVRRTGSMVFTRGKLSVDGRPVLIANAVIKRLRPQPKPDR